MFARLTWITSNALLLLIKLEREGNGEGGTKQFLRLIKNSAIKTFNLTLKVTVVVVILHC